MYNPIIQFSNTCNHEKKKTLIIARMTNLVNMDIKRAKSYGNRYTNWYNEPIVQFRSNHRHQAMESVNSGENSPPLWKNNTPSPPKSPSHPLLGHHHHHRSPSSDSRARAIARGQWELMEMVRNMPESSYELSLKDLVENQEKRVDHGSLENNQDHLHQTAVVKSKRSQEESKKIMNDHRINNATSFENKGFFLNMVFPFSLKCKKKKNKFGSNNSNSKVSPKVDGLKGNGEKDWWKKRFTGSSDSDSSRTSNNSGGTTTTTVSSGGGSSSSRGRGRDGGRKRNGLLTGCWPFLCSGRGKSVE